MQVQGGILLSLAMRGILCMAQTCSTANYEMVSEGHSLLFDVCVPLEHSECWKQNHHLQKEFVKWVAMDQLNQRCKCLWAVLTVGPATANSPLGFYSFHAPAKLQECRGGQTSVHCLLHTFSMLSYVSTHQPKTLLGLIHNTTAEPCASWDHVRRHFSGWWSFFPLWRDLKQTNQSHSIRVWGLESPLSHEKKRL